MLTVVRLARWAIACRSRSAQVVSATGESSSPQRNPSPVYPHSAALSGKPSADRWWAEPCNELVDVDSTVCPCTIEPKRSAKRSYDEATAARLWQVSADLVDT
jgi:hypothetical protein